MDVHETLASRHMEVTLQRDCRKCVNVIKYVRETFGCPLWVAQKTASQAHLQKHMTEDDTHAF